MMVTLKITKKRIFLTVLLIAVMVSAIAAGRMFLQSDVVSAWLNKGVRGASEGERQEFIISYGWQVDAEPVEVTEVLLPKKFDDVYTAYNNMQKEQGFDLEKYAGKRAKRYTYVVHNYPDYSGGVRLNIVVQGNKIIAGDVCSLELDGFMHGLSLPSGKKPPAPTAPPAQTGLVQEQLQTSAPPASSQAESQSSAQRTGQTIAIDTSDITDVNSGG